MDSILSWRQGYASFPSGHTAVTCAVIAVLWVYCPAWRVLCVHAVLGVDVGLIGANYHFLSDLIAGGFVGTSSGWMMTSRGRRTGSSGIANDSFACPSFGAS